ncbi:hypothetical protein [Sphingobium yanoikuyae]|uniref:hypothetical protein n=2 Tax=Sphingobium yanoikuyae TaxID=13690 RepID=UPI001E53D054|nr:hypothetical protein [Sphingobium yanoikuyae]
MRDILPCDDQFIAWVIAPAQQNLGMQTLGVELVDRDPIQLRAEVLLDLGHQSPDLGLEVRIFHAALGGNDEAKLMAVAGGPLQEITAIGAVGLRAIKLARQALAGDPVALDVSHVRAGGLAALASRLAFTTARRPRKPASRSRLDSNRPILAPRPIRLPSNRRAGTPVFVPARHTAARMHQPYLTTFLPSLPRWLPSLGVKSSSDITTCLSLAISRRKWLILAIPALIASWPRLHVT